MSRRTSAGPIRCPWAEDDPLLRAYHDEEWGVPQHDGRALWEMLMLEGFQAGLSWRVIRRKRAAFRSAFLNFDPERVAQFGPPEVGRLMRDPGIVRSRAKIEATVGGARAFLALRAEGKEFGEYVWGLVGGNPAQRTGPVPAKSRLSEAISKELKARGFKFVGPVIVYAWMEAIGMVNDHDPSCFRRAPIAAMGRPGAGRRAP